MNNAILILGESGSGKSTSLRNLNPKETFIIQVVKKNLPFKGWKTNYKQYNNETKKGNLSHAIKAENVVSWLKFVSENMKDIKNIVIDDFQYIMANEFMSRAKEKGYEKFTEMGQNIYNIINSFDKLRNDINIFVLSHTDTDDFGKRKMKTIGKMLDDKICLEGLFTIVLHTHVSDGNYTFETNSSGMSTAKSPMGMFESREIENDLHKVIEQIKSYEGE